MVASERSPASAPLAALLFDPAHAIGIDELIGAATDTGGFAVSHAPPPSEGWAELLRDGLTFDIHGLRGGSKLDVPSIAHRVGPELPATDGLGVLTLAPGPHLAGAERLLPVIRVVAALLLDLAKIPGVRAVCWLPARNAVVPIWFERAVTPWLEGGPFPAMALVSLHRDSAGAIQTEGLNFLIGQEFVLAPGGAGDDSMLARVALRLVDWLVAHGPVDQPVEAVLAGTGAVFLEATGGARIVARCV